MNKVYAVGIGPGGKKYLTEEALEALGRSELIVGYTVYTELIKPFFPEKEYFATPMMQEIDRCRYAIEQALTGKTVSVVSSGDAGVYGMAGLLFELAEQYEDLDVEVVSGLTAALSGGAVLGAPIGHDFCVISLSDLLTPWELIERRLRAAAYGDFSVAIYNPSSRKRKDYLARACRILLEYKAGETVSGWVRNIGREGEEAKILTLAELEKEEVDMFTTVFVGTKTTRVINGKMVTPRGYEKHEDTYFRRDDGGEKDL